MKGRLKSQAAADRPSLTPADPKGQEATVKSSPPQMESLTPCKVLVFPSPTVIKNGTQSNYVLIFETLSRNLNDPEVLIKQTYF